ncbi:hypothetical protein PUN28_012603 [Cardiocondyla obscurior]|uniref:Uncharacterized protein n=1 Tax=Cardiocondyla obscurior TaxID=286306 RepID=A0AAW2FHZ4_9HYME
MSKPPAVHRSGAERREIHARLFANRTTRQLRQGVGGVETIRKEERAVGRKRETEEEKDAGAGREARKGRRRERARRAFSDVIRKCLTRHRSGPGGDGSDEGAERASRRAASGGRSMTSREFRAGLSRGVRPPPVSRRVIQVQRQIPFPLKLRAPGSVGPGEL